MRVDFIFFISMWCLQFAGLSQEVDIRWQQFQDSILVLEQDSLYGEAMQFLQDFKKDFEERWFELSREEIYLNEKLGNEEANLSIFREAHQKGYFYFIHPNLPKFEPYLRLPGFREISERDLALREDSIAESKLRFDVDLPGNFDQQKAYPVLIIFHGGGSSLQRVKKHWYSEQLDQMFIKIYLQNYLYYDSNTYGWRTGDVRAFESLEKLFFDLQDAYRFDPGDVWVAGISAGGTFAIDVAVRQVIPVRGFLTFCPGLPKILHPEYDRHLMPTIRGFMLGGVDDFYLDKQKQMMKIFGEKGVSCKHVILEEMGHGYPSEEEKWIDEGFAFLRK